MFKFLFKFLFPHFAVRIVVFDGRVFPPCQFLKPPFRTLPRGKPFFFPIRVQVRRLVAICVMNVTEANTVQRVISDGMILFVEIVVRVKLRSVDRAARILALVTGLGLDDLSPFAQ